MAEIFPGLMEDGSSRIQVALQNSSRIDLSGPFAMYLHVNEFRFLCEIVLKRHYGIMLYTLFFDLLFSLDSMSWKIF